MRNIALTLHIDDNVPQIIRSAPSKLKQILTNLVGNATKFTYSGNIWVRAQCQTHNGQERIAISVEDTGIGMSAKALRNLQKLLGGDDEEEMIMQQASGIGLNIINRLSKQVYEGDGGGIKVESTDKEGSTFKFLIDCSLQDHHVPDNESHGSEDLGEADEGSGSIFPNFKHNFRPNQ